MPTTTPGTLHRPLIILLLLLLVPLLATAGSRPTHAADVTAIDFSGPLTVTQGDGAGCSFSAAPFTSGTLTLAVLTDQEYGRADMTGGGAGERRGLICDDWVGDMVWSTNYVIEAEGPVVIDGPAFSWIGTIRGNGFHEWTNCTVDGQPVMCPEGSEGPYEFPVVMTGSLTCNGESLGRLIFPTLGTTSGDWGAQVDWPDGWTLVRTDGALTLNGTPLLHSCPVPAADGDRLATAAEARLSLVCTREELPVGRAIRVVLTALEQNSAGTILSMILEEEFCELGRGAAAAHAGVAQEDTAVRFELQRGLLAVITPLDGPEIAIQAPQATAVLGGASQVRARAYDDGRSQFATLGGPLAITPANPALLPFTLNPAQQVTVREDSVDDIIELSLINLPYIGRAQ